MPVTEITPGDVVGWLGDEAPTGGPSAALDRAIAAVTELADARLIADTVAADPTPQTVQLALIMQAARLWKRTATPDGIAGNADVGIIRISRFDPDIADLLGDHLQLGAA